MSVKSDSYIGWSISQSINEKVRPIITYRKCLMTCTFFWDDFFRQIRQISRQSKVIFYLPPTKEEVHVFARVCLSVCLSFSKITQKRVHRFGWNVACRQMSGHRPDLSPIRVIVQMPESDCFLRYRISAATRNFTWGKSHWRRAATASRGFKMGLFTEPSEDLCRR